MLNEDKLLTVHDSVFYVSEEDDRIFQCEIMSVKVSEGLDENGSKQTSVRYKMKYLNEDSDFTGIPERTFTNIHDAVVCLLEVTRDNSIDSLSGLALKDYELMIERVRDVNEARQLVAKS